MHDGRLASILEQRTGRTLGLDCIGQPLARAPPICLLSLLLLLAHHVIAVRTFNDLFLYVCVCVCVCVLQQFPSENGETGGYGDA